MGNFGFYSKLKTKTCFCLMFFCLYRNDPGLLGFDEFSWIQSTRRLMNKGKSPCKTLGSDVWKHSGTDMNKQTSDLLEGENPKETLIATQFDPKIMRNDVLQPFDKLREERHRIPTSSLA